MLEQQQICFEVRLVIFEALCYQGNISLYVRDSQKRYSSLRILKLLSKVFTGTLLHVIALHWLISPLRLCNYYEDTCLLVVNLDFEVMSCNRFISLSQEARIGTSDLLITSWPALPAELQPPLDFDVVLLYAYQVCVRLLKKQHQWNK